MAGLKISQLTKLEQMTGTEAIPVEKGGENYSMTPDVLLKDVKGGMAGLVTRLNDYAYDVSLLMGKMAVRGTKGASKTTQPYGSGYYHVDGSYTELGSSPYGGTVIVDENKVYHFDIGYHKYTNIADDAAVLVLFDENDKVLTAVPWAEGGFLDKYLVFTSEVKKYGVTYNISPAIKPYPSICNETYEIQDINDVISGLNTEISTIKSTVEALDPVTKDTFNDYMYDVSELMGKMAVRGTRVQARPDIDGQGVGAWEINGEIGSSNYARDRYFVKPNHVYHINIAYPANFTPSENIALLLLYDKDGNILKAIPATEAPFDKYLCFTSEVYKYGVSYTTYPGSVNDYVGEYEIEDVNDVLSDLSGKDSSMRDDFNNYISDVTNLFGKMAYRDGIGTDLANPIAGSYIRLSDGVLVQSDDSFSYQYVDVDSTKCYHLQNLISGSTISMLALYDEDGGLIKSYRVLIDGYFVFKGVSRIGLSGTTVSIQRKFTIKSFDISDITSVINTQQGNRALYVAAGAVYNKQTGFYELNGLTDITEEQMREIYICTADLDKRTDWRGGLASKTFRTNLGFRTNTIYDYINRTFNLFNALRGNMNLVVLHVGPETSDAFKLYPFIIFRLGDCFYQTSVKKIEGFIKFDFQNINLTRLTLIEYIRIVQLNTNINFGASPNITLDSLQFLIQEAINTSPITVTVHADVYAKIQDETQTDWHALIEAAAAKQITFATV